MENNFKLIKYSTENLECYFEKDTSGQKYYQIWEKKFKESPVAIYIDMKHQIQLNNKKIPLPETKYEYFSEMCEIIKFLSKSENE